VIKTKKVQVIDVNDWDELVKKTYGKPYNFQQQDDCQPRDKFNLTIPSSYTDDEEMHDEIPMIVNGPEMGVKFKVWLDTDPNNKVLIKNYVMNNGPIGELQETNDIHYKEMVWGRNFYPDIYTLANDLYEKGLIKAGKYLIDIDW